MIDFITIGLFVIVFCLVYLYLKARPPSCLPPGPKGWPFIGHLDMIYYGKEMKFHVKTAEWGKEYGGLYSLQVGQTSCIMVTDLDILREMLLDSDIWSERPLQMDFLKLIAKQAPGVLLNNGEAWKQLRRVTIHSLRDFGMGKNTIEEKIQEEILEVIKEVESFKDKPMQLDFILTRATANVICSVLFGNRYSYNDPAYQEVIYGMSQIFRFSGMQNIFIYLPWYTFWMIPLQSKIREVFKHNNRLLDFARNAVKEHRQSYDPGNIRDFVDLYIEAEQTQRNTLLTEKMMFGTIIDLFMAGTETTSTSVLWTILFLVKYPEVQDKCRQDILQKVGNSRLPTYKDKNDLPYVEATLSEAMRLGNTAPVLFLNNTSKTTPFRGHTIPKDTLLMMNLYAIHMDPKYWENPKMFKPERFLDENGAYKRQDAFIPFGLGSRACLGETLARMEIFLFATTLLQRFKFVADDPSKLPSVENANIGISLTPEPFSIRAIKL